MHRRTVVPFLLALLTVLLGACSDALSSTGAASQAALLEMRSGTWRLESIDTEDGGVVAPGGEVYTVSFDAEGRVGGRAGGEYYGGQYEVLSSRGMRVWALATTGPVSTDARTLAFLASLQTTRSYEVDRRTLRLRFGDGGVLRFRSEY